MRKRFQLKTTVPSWIFLGFALMLFAMCWVEIVRLASSTNFSITFRSLSITYPFYVQIALSLVPYLIWIVFLSIGRKHRSTGQTIKAVFGTGIGNGGTINIIDTLNGSGNFMPETGTTTASDIKAVFLRVVRCA